MDDNHISAILEMVQKGTIDASDGAILITALRSSPIPFIPPSPFNPTYPSPWTVIHGAHSI